MNLEANLKQKTYLKTEAQQMESVFWGLYACWLFLTFHHASKNRENIRLPKEDPAHKSLELARRQKV